MNATTQLKDLILGPELEIIENYIRRNFGSILSLTHDNVTINKDGKKKTMQCIQHYISIENNTQTNIKNTRINIRSNFFALFVILPDENLQGFLDAFSSMKSHDSTTIEIEEKTYLEDKSIPSAKHLFVGCFDQESSIHYVDNGKFIIFSFGFEEYKYIDEVFSQVMSVMVNFSEKKNRSKN